MAIRPVDLQLAYLAGPQSAAQTSVAQQAGANAQQSTAAAFASQIAQREETVAKTEQEARLSPDADGQGGAEYQPGQRRETSEQSEPSLLASDGEHFIDVSC